jgi:hypothetical protein
MATTIQTIDCSNAVVCDANGRIVSREEQAAIARQWGRPDISDEILGIERPWYVRLWRAVR